MTAITVTWTSKTAALLDPTKPITTGLKNAEWDDMEFLKQWLGESYIAGAVQNHNHDGINSAPIEALPNLLKNASFETDGGSGIPQGWTFTAYTGGSAAMSTAQNAHAATSIAITSTVLANGGGYLDNDVYFDVGGGELYEWKLWRWASVAGVSSKAEVIWYDSAKSQISASTLFNITSTETAAYCVEDIVVAPATARYAKLRLTGGVAGAGTSVGTVYFDGAEVMRATRIRFDSGTLSGNAVTISGLPVPAKRIVIDATGINANNGSAALSLLIGPSSGVETSGYAGTTLDVTGTTATAAAGSSAAISLRSSFAAGSVNMRIVMEKIQGTNQWKICAEGDTSGYSSWSSEYIKTLAGDIYSIQFKLSGAYSFISGRATIEVDV